MAVLYTTKVKVHGGRAGHARSDDGRLDFALVPPKDLPSGRQGVNPEQLFAAGYAACFESSIRGAARRSGKSLADASVEATVSLVSRDGGGFASAFHFGLAWHSSESLRTHPVRHRGIE